MRCRELRGSWQRRTLSGRGKSRHAARRPEQCAGRRAACRRTSAAAGRCAISTAACREADLYFVANGGRELSRRCARSASAGNSRNSGGPTPAASSRLPSSEESAAAPACRCDSGRRSRCSSCSAHAGASRPIRRGLPSRAMAKILPRAHDRGGPRRCCRRFDLSRFRGLAAGRYASRPAGRAAA